MLYNDSRQTLFFEAKYYLKMYKNLYSGDCFSRQLFKDWALWVDNSHDLWYNKIKTLKKILAYHPVDFCSLYNSITFCKYIWSAYKRHLAQFKGVYLIGG